MRSALGISVIASTAVLVTGCVGDSSPYESRNEPKATTEDEAGDATTEATETEPDDESDVDAWSDESEIAVTPQAPIDAGTSTEAATGPETSDTVPTVPAPVEAEPEADAGATPGHTAPTTDEPPDGGDRDDTDAAAGGGDGGAFPVACQHACATAGSKGCPNFDCQQDVCSFRDIAPTCHAEAETYLECIANADLEDDFVCNGDQRPEFVGDQCEDPYLFWWLECFDATE